MAVSILLLQNGCLYAVRYDGPYHGKVVDELTREPIEGVVVLGSWWVYHFGLGGGYTTYHDAREAVTDKNGEFTINGEGLRILSRVCILSFNLLILFEKSILVKQNQQGGIDELFERNDAYI